MMPLAALSVLGAAAALEDALIGQSAGADRERAAAEPYAAAAADGEVHGGVRAAGLLEAGAGRGTIADVFGAADNTPVPLRA